MLRYKTPLQLTHLAFGQMARVCAFISMAYGASMATFAAQPSTNLPTGGQVAAGQANMAQSGNTLIIQQTSQRAVLNWNTFNVGGNAAVEFKQPNSQAVVLNRVTSATPSQIDGAINANGRVIISNTNGVIFGKGAEVNVGALVATTMNQSDAEFMSGSNTFEGNGTGKVMNKGKISITDPQGYVALLAPEVRNQGVILATVSSHNAVVLGAAEKLTLNFKDSNLIGITVDKAAVNALIQNKRAIEVSGGIIVLAAASANQLIRSVIQNSGQISASSMTSHGGVVELIAGTVNNNGQIAANAKGVGNGGSVSIVADNVKLNSQSDIQVNAGTHGNGGAIHIWANQQAAIAGQLSATGGSVSGNGGSIGTSAKLSVTFDSNLKINTSSTHGRFGQWVIDPLELTIDNNTANLISAALRKTNVTLDATGSACVGGLANCNNSMLPLVNFLSGANIYSENASTTLRVLATGGTVNVNNNIDAGQVYIEAANISVKGNIGSTGGANGSIVLLGGQINILGGLGSNGQGTIFSNATTIIGSNRRRLGANTGVSSVDSSYTTSGGTILITATGDVLIDADASITVNGLSGGYVSIVSQMGMVTHRGVVDAVGSGNQGGYIKFEADNINLEASSQTNAVGALGGGTVLVGGDWQGSGNVRQATLVTMRSGATIDASAIQNGNGGKVVLWSDIHNAKSVTSVSGTIFAAGGMNGGDGGKVETSGRLLKVDGVQVNTSAKGIAGNWLLDPYHIVINTGGSDTTNSSGTFTSNVCTTVNAVCVSSYIDHSVIEAALNSGNVTIQTDPGKNIIVQSDGTISTNSSNTLTFNSGGDITFDYTAPNGGMNASNLVFVMNASGAVSNTAPLTVKSITVSSTGFSGGGDLNLGSGGLTVTQSGNSTYSGVISGINALLTKNGTGALTLSGASTFSGGITVNAGVLKLGANPHSTVANNGGGGGGNLLGTLLDSPLGLGSIRINAGATLDTNGFDIASKFALNRPTLFMSGASAASQAKLINSSTTSSTVYSNILLTNTTTANALANVIGQSTGVGTLKVSMSISDDIGASYAGLKIGEAGYLGKVIFNGNNSFQGGLSISAGTLQIGYVTSLGVGPINVVSGAVLDLNGQDVNSTGTLTLNGTGISNSGALINTSVDPSTYPGLVALGSATSVVGDTGTIALTNTGTMLGNSFSLTLGGAQGGLINSVIGTGTGTVIKSDSGKWTLTGTNTYSGITTINAGILAITSDRSLGAVPSSTLVNSITLNGGTLQAIGLDGETSENVISLDSKRGVTMTASSGLAATTTTTNGTTYTDVLSVGGIVTGAANMTINGAGEGGIVKYAGVNTYGDTGKTTNIVSGTLQLVSSKLSHPYTNLDIANGATFRNSSISSISFVSQSTISGAGTIIKDTSTASTLSLQNGNNTFSGTIVNKAGTLELQTTGAAGSSTIYLGDTVSGSNAATLNAVNTGTTIANSIILNPYGSITVGNGGYNNITFTGGITGNNNLKISKTGVNPTAMTFSGGTIDIAGTIEHMGGQGTLSITAPIGSNVTGITQNNNQGLMSVSGPVLVNSNGTTFTNVNGSASGQKLTLSGVVSGTGNLILQNNGAVTDGVTLSTSPSIIGSIINSGTSTGSSLVSAALGSSIVSVIQNSSTSPFTVSGLITLGANGISLIANNANTLKELNVTGGVTGTGNLTIQNNSAVANGVTIKTTSVSITGTITNSGTGSGNGLISSTVGSGVSSIIENSTSSALTVSGAVTVNANGTSLVNNNASGSAVLTLSGGFNGDGNLIVNNNSSINSGITLSSGLISNVGSITNSGTGTGSTVISAPLASSTVTNLTSVIQNSATSMLTLSGNNTYFVGPSTITAGILSFSAANNLGAASGDASKLVIDGGTLQFAGTASSASLDRLFTIGPNGATLDAAGTQLFNFTRSAPTIALGSSSSVTLTLTGSGSGGGSLGSYILANPTSGTTSLLKSGSGTWTLGGLSTYTGTTSINAGTISVATLPNGGVAGPIGASASSAGNLLLDGGTLKYVGSAATSTDRLFTVGANGGTIDSSGTSVVQYVYGSLTFSNTGLIATTQSTNPRLKLFHSANAVNVFNPVWSDPVSGVSQLQVSSSTSASGSWRLSGVNTYTGLTTISVSGNLSVGNANALSTSSVLITGTNSLLSVAGYTLSNPIELNGGGVQGSNVTLSGNITLTANSLLKPSSSSQAITVSGLITDSGSGYGLTMTSASGLVVLTNTANAYSGSTVVNGGAILRVTSTAALSSTTALILDGGSFDAYGLAFSRNLTVSGTSYSTLFSSTGQADWQGGITLNKNLYLGSTVGGSSPILVSGKITGSGSLTNYYGTASISSTSNDFSGGINVMSGTLVLLANAALPATRAVTVAGGILDIGGLSVDRLITLSSGTLVSSNGELTGGVTLANSGNSGALAAATGTTLIVKTGAITGSSGIVNIGETSRLGTVLFKNDNSYGGGTTVNYGVLKIETTGALGTGVLTAGGGGLDLNGQSISNALKLSGTGLSSGGALFNSSASAVSLPGLLTLTGSTPSIVANNGSISLTNAGTVTGTGTLSLGGSQGGTINSILGWTGGLTKQGAGTWLLTGANTYTTTTTVSAGTLKFGSDYVSTSSAVTSSPIGKSNLIINAGGILDLNGHDLGASTQTTGIPTITMSGTGTTASTQAYLINSASTAATVYAPITMSAVTSANTLANVIGQAPGGTLTVSGLISNTGTAAGLQIGDVNNTGMVVLYGPAVTATGSYTGSTSVASGTSLKLKLNSANTSTSTSFNSTYAGTGSIIIEPITTGGSIALGGTGSVLNLATTLFTGTSGSGRKFADGFEQIVIGSNVAGNLSIAANAAASFSDSLTLISGANFTINSGASVSTSQASGNLVVAATGNFLNLSGSSALQTTDAGNTDRWIVYSNSPSTNNFGVSGTLVSGNKAYWGSTYSTLVPASVGAGNRYVFNAGGSVTITTTNASMTYGFPIDLSNNYTITSSSLDAAPTGTPFVVNGVSDLLTTLPTLVSIGNTANASIGQYDITASGAVGTANFSTVTYVNTGKLSVNPATITLNILGSKAYDGSAVFDASPSNTNVTVTGLANGNTLATITANSPNVSANGSNYFVSFTMGNGTASNYVLVSGYNASTNSATITPAVLTYTATPASSIYGNTPSVNAGTVTGFVPGDNLGNATTGTMLFSTTATSGTSVGNYAVNGSGLTANNGNYTFTQAVGNSTALTVSPAVLTVSGTKVYDGNVNFGFAQMSVSGAKNGETVALTAGSAVASAASVATYAGTSLSNLAIGVTGGNASVANYTLPSTGSMSITSRSVALTANAQSTTHGTALSLGTSAYTLSSGSLASGDAISAVTLQYNGNATVPSTTGAGTYTNGIVSSGATGTGGFNTTNYAITYAPADLTVNQKAITLTANAQSTTYGTALSLGTSAFTLTSGALVNGDTISAVTLKYNNLTTVPATTNAATYANGIVASAATGTGGFNTTNYAITYSPADLTVNQKTITLSANAQSTTYGTALSLGTSAYTLSSGSLASGDAISAVTLQYNGNATVPGTTNAATYANGIVASGAAGTGGFNTTNYAVTYSSADLTVNQKAVTITNNVSSTTYNATSTYANLMSTAGFSATALAGSDVIGSVTQNYTVGGTAVSGSAQAGTFVATPSAAVLSTGNVNNYTFTYVPSINTVAKANVSFTATASLTGNVYNGSAYTGTYTSTLLGADTATVTGLATGINAGTYTSNLQVSGASLSNYNTPVITNASLVIDQKPLTISGQTAVNKVYNGTTAAALDSSNASLVGVVSGDAVTLDAGNAYGIFASANVNNGVGVTVAGNALSGAKAANYSLSQPTGLIANITPAPLVVTANDDAKFVTQSDTAGFKGVSYSGFVAGQGAADLGGALAITRTNSSQNNAGLYAGVLVPSGLTSTNYSITFANGDYTIVPAQTLLISTPNTSVTYGAGISLSPLSVKYLDGANLLKTLTQTSATGNTFTYSDDVGGSATFTLAGVGSTSTSGKLVVGNYDITGLSFSKVSNNFNNPPVYTGVLTVSQQSVVASTTTVSKVYDGTTAMNGLSLALSNVVPSDVVTVGGVGAFAQANKGANINYSVSNLTLTGADSSNYYLSGGNSFSGNNGEITVAPLSVVGATTNTTYTGLLQTNAAATVTGLKGNDAFTVTGYASGTNASTTPYADSLLATPASGTSANNYSITYTNGALNIAKAPLTVTAISLTKPYDGRLFSGGNGVTYSGFVNNETLAVLGGTLAYSGTSQGASNAGTYVLTPAGLSSTNYVFNYVLGSLVIQPVVVVPEPDYWSIQGSLTGTISKAYDGTTSASLLPSNYVLTGFISGQGATVLKSQGVYDNANVDTGKLVTVSLQTSDFQATGNTNLANYILPTSISSRVGVISKATVSVIADKLSKPFMGVDPALTYTVSGLAGRDVNAQVLTGSPSRTPGEALGTYSVSVGSLAVSSNYELVFTPGSLQVVPGVLSSASSVFPFERKAQIGFVNTSTPVLLPEVSCFKPLIASNSCAKAISMQGL